MTFGFRADRRPSPVLFGALDGFLGQMITRAHRVVLVRGYGLAAIARACGDVLTQLRLGARAADSGKTRGRRDNSKVPLNRFTS